MLSVQIDAETERRLAVVSAATGDAPDLLARKALLAYLEDLEDYAAAVEAWREHEADPSKAISMEQMLSELGLDA